MVTVILTICSYSFALVVAAVIATYLGRDEDTIAIIIGGPCVWFVLAVVGTVFFIKEDKIHYTEEMYERLKAANWRMFRWHRVLLVAKYRQVTPKGRINVWRLRIIKK